ncbi:hypothetical protein SOVF_149150 [Spinacia oleracea]|nr:hypothetical protein SOVF_149150 [Spinacia oleracea]
MELTPRSAGSSSSNSRASLIEIDVKCNHNITAVLRTVKKGSRNNIGKRFYGCPLWPRGDCGFFQWECSGCAELQSKLSMKEKELTIVEEMVEKMKAKKVGHEEIVRELKAELSHTRIELMRSARVEKYAAMAVLLSWVIFVVILMLIN